MTLSDDPVRMRMFAADPAGAKDEAPVGVMDAEALLELIDERSEGRSRGLDPLERTMRRRPQRRWRAAWAFGGAFAIATAAIAVAVILAGGPADDAVDQPASTTATATREVPTTVTATTAVPTTAAPTTTVQVPDAVSIIWRPVVVEGASNLYFYAAASDGERVVVIGDAIGEDVPLVWTSEDGLAWQPWTGEELHSGLVFAGPDGMTTLDVEELPTTEETGFSEVAAVAAGGPGWVAVGRHEADGRVWVSSDAQTWQRVEAPVFTGAWLGDVAAGGPGLVAVGGFHGIPDGKEEAGVWVSTDGLQWDRVDSTALGDEKALASVTVNPADGSLLAFGTRAVWASPDGYEWTAVHHRDNVVWLSQPPPHADTVWVEDTVFAAGGDVAFSLWASADRGATWVRHDPADPIFAGQNINALLLHRGKLVAVGGNSEGNENLDIGQDPIQGDPARGVIWIGEVE